jgi:hypothetical protein
MKSVEARLTLGLYQAADQVEHDGQHQAPDDGNMQVKEKVECDEHDNEHSQMQQDVFVHGCPLV